VIGTEHGAAVPRCGRALICPGFNTQDRPGVRGLRCRQPRAAHVHPGSHPRRRPGLLWPALPRGDAPAGPRRLIAVPTTWVRGFDAAGERVEQLEDAPVQPHAGGW